MRVISGKYGSRPLKAVPGMNTRPTTDKIKESMFNLLSDNQNIGYVLDFYGGSGALGIEAVSRGAKHAVICEKHRLAIQTIRENIGMTKEVEKFTVLSGENHFSLKTFLEKQPNIVFDCVFLDPPYARETIEKDVFFLNAMGCLSPSAKLVCENDVNTELPESIEGFNLIKDKTYGMSRIRIYNKGEHHER